MLLNAAALPHIARVDAFIDHKAGAVYKEQPLALDWVRLAKVAEESGEAVDALIVLTAANPRKKSSKTLDDVLDELGDTAMAAILAVQHFTKDTERTAEVLRRALSKAVRRADELQS
jgi:NTP pyrophosphatase (non-canonical NTP hydrolase)